MQYAHTHYRSNVARLNGFWLNVKEPNMFIFFFAISVQLFAEKVIFDSPFLHSGNRLAFLIQDKKIFKCVYFI